MKVPRSSPSEFRYEGRYCQEEIPAFPIHEKKDGAIRGAADGGAKLVDRLHRLAVHLLDDVARLNTRVGRAAVRIDLLHDQTAGIPRQAGARGQLRCQRRDRHTECRLVVGIGVSVVARVL